MNFFDNMTFYCEFVLQNGRVIVPKYRFFSFLGIFAEKNRILAKNWPKIGLFQAKIRLLLVEIGHFWVQNSDFFTRLAIFSYLGCLINGKEPSDHFKTFICTRNSSKIGENLEKSDLPNTSPPIFQIGPLCPPVFEKPF